MRTKLLTLGFLLLVLLGFLWMDAQPQSFVYQNDKMKGLSFVAPRNPISSKELLETKRVNANWVSLMPYSFLPNGEAKLRFIKTGGINKNAHQWWGEQPEGVITCIRLAKEAGLKVMLKPHIWLADGQYTGKLELKQWLEFEQSLAEFILQYAKIAELENTEILCIGTEMENMVKHRPDFWFKLIAEIKKVYHGKLTYAENWDCFENVPFWTELDYIGIDGYFPLADEQNPELDKLKKGWKKHLKIMDKFARKHQKPIIFTEFGFRSCDFAADKPWETDYSLPSNEGLQANAYQSVFDEVWSKPWFAGGFVWKWFPEKDSNRESSDKFCPQHKLAEEVIRKNYALF